MEEGTTPQGDPRAQAKVFGLHVAKLRQQMQMPGYRKVSQESLAGLMGTNKSQISRIEHGKVRVTRRTVEKLAGALQLAPRQRQKLFRLAGFHADSSTAYPPQQADFERAVAQVRDSWLTSSPPPAVVIDRTWRIWEANPVFARLFSTVSPSEMAQRNLLELAYDTKLGLRAALYGRITDDDLNAFLTSQTTKFAALHQQDVRASWYVELLDRLRGFQEFQAAWGRALAGRANPRADREVLRFAGGERLVMYMTPLDTDDRFLLVRYLPADLAAARLLE